MMKRIGMLKIGSWFMHQHGTRRTVRPWLWGPIPFVIAVAMACGSA